MAEYGYGSGVGIISVTLSRLTDLLSKTEFVSKDNFVTLTYLFSVLSESMVPASMPLSPSALNICCLVVTVGGNSKPAFKSSSPPAKLTTISRLSPAKLLPL